MAGRWLLGAIPLLKRLERSASRWCWTCRTKDGEAAWNRNTRQWCWDRRLGRWITGQGSLGHLWQRLESPTLTPSLQPPTTVSHKICSLLPKTTDTQKMVFPFTSVKMFYVSWQLILLSFFLLCFVYDDFFPPSWQATLSRLLIPLISLLSVHAGLKHGLVFPPVSHTN